MTDSVATSSGWDPEEPVGGGGSRGRRRWLVAAAAVVVLLVLAGAATFAYAKLSGRGAQPETALPASTIAVAKVDLDPAAGQKLAAYRLSRKFPHSGVGTDQAGIGSDLVRTATGRTDSGIDFDRDVKPWLGSRAAVAAVATGDAADPVATVAAVACTDQAAMTAGLDRIRAAGGATGSFGYRYRDGYVLIGKDQTTVDAVSTAAAAHPLWAADTFGRDAAALGGDQIGVAWADLGAGYRALSAADRAETTKALGGQEPAGRYVMGLHVTDSSVELSGRGFDLRVPGGYAALGTAPTGGFLLGGLPADGVSGLSVTGLGDSVRAAWKAFDGGDGAGSGGAGSDEDGLFGDLGITLPDDLVGLLGSQTAVWVGADGESGGLRARTPDGAAAERTATTVLRSLQEQDADTADGLDTPGADDPELGTDDPYSDDPDADYPGADDPLTSAVVVRPAGGNDVVVGTDNAAAAAIASPAHPLRDRPGFAAVVPDAATAGIASWVDLSRVVQLAGSDLSADDRDDLAPLDQLGFTGTAGGDWPFRLRLTVH